MYWLVRCPTPRRSLTEVVDQNPLVARPATTYHSTDNLIAPRILISEIVFLVPFRSVNSDNIVEVDVLVPLCRDGYDRLRTHFPVADKFRY